MTVGCAQMTPYCGQGCFDCARGRSARDDGLLWSGGGGGGVGGLFVGGVEREKDGYLGSVVLGGRAALDGTAPAVAFDELTGDEEADPGADGAGGEEGLEDPVEIFLRDA